MTVEQAEVIDYIGTDRATGDVILSVADHLPWGEWFDDHAVALEQKLASYVRFIESGQVLKDYPKAVGRVVRIEAMLLHDPDEAGIQLLSTARESLASRGVAFAWRVPENRLGRTHPSSTPQRMSPKRLLTIRCQPSLHAPDNNTMNPTSASANGLQRLRLSWC